MKIVCDACSAKYSIADEKVKGKVFKIRCKKCSNIIVVRGNAGAAADDAAAAPPAGQFDQKETRVYDYGGYEGGEAPPAGDDAVWHVVIDQEQVGPISVAEVGQRFAAGEIDAETYIWREGFADWLPLNQVPDFSALVAGGGTTTAQPSSGQDAVASMFGAGGGDFADAGGTSRSDPNDVFAAHAAKQAAEADDGGDGADDLFGQSAKQKGASAGGGRAAAPAAAAASSPSSMKGQRSENSVLFSLNNLAALASDSPKASPAQSSSSSSSASAGGGAQHGGGEGSGLIDIRSMASAYLGGSAKGGAAGAPTGRNVGSIDDLPVFSTASFSEPAVIIPTLGAHRGSNKLVYALLGAVALLAVVLVIVVVVVLGKKDKGGAEVAGGQVASNDRGNEKATGAESGTDKATGTEPGTAAATGTEPGTAAATGADKATGTEPGTAAATGASPGTAKPPGDDKGSSKASGSDRGTRTSSSGSDRGTRTSSSGSDKGTAKASAEKPPADTGGKCMDEVACLLADKPPACCSKYRGGGGGGGGGGGTTKPPPDKGNSNLPEDLTKSDISAGIAKVRSAVEGCAAKSSAKGTVKVSVKVAGGGNVSSVTVKESPDPSLGNCVTNAVKKATFTKTQNGGSFAYPFTFR